MRGYLLLAPLLLPIAACHDRDDGASVTINGSDGRTLASADSGKGEMKVDLPGFQGTIKLPKVELKADNFDLNGVHLYPGSTIDGFNIDAGAGKDDGRVRVVFTSPATPATVRDWLMPRLNAARFEVKAAGDGLVGTTDDRKPFRLNLTPAGADRARGTIIMGS